MNNLHVNAAISFPPLERSLSMADPDFEVGLWGEREREREGGGGGVLTLPAFHLSVVSTFLPTCIIGRGQSNHQSRPNI